MSRLTGSHSGKRRNVRTSSIEVRPLFQDKELTMLDR
jgi:hypothetical protein